MLIVHQQQLDLDGSSFFKDDGSVQKDGGLTRSVDVLL
jgi:hypothetical protein